MSQPYRIPGERTEEKVMDENTRDTIIAKCVAAVIVAGLSLAAGTCAYTTHDETRGKVDVEIYKVEQAKADRDRAMFDSMSKNER